MTPTAPDAAELAVLAAYAPHLAQAFASLACDIALVLDGQGRITAVAHNEARSLAPASAGWLGRRLVETVTLETRFKIEALLDEVERDGLARRREVNLPQDEGDEPVAVAYTALRLGPTGPVLAVGQDLRAVARMQQRFLRVQRELERGYIAALAAGRMGDAAALPGLEEGPLDEASRAAFAAWLRAEREAGDPPSPPEKDPGAPH